MTSELDIAPEDVDTLLEALQAWEAKDLAGDIMGDLLTAMLTNKSDPTAKERETADREKRQKERTTAAAIRKEQSVLLQAKLLRFRNRALVASIERGAGL